MANFPTELKTHKVARRVITYEECRYGDHQSKGQTMHPLGMAKKKKRSEGRRDRVF